MIHSSRSLVTLQPARQAALQAIMTVEDARQRGARLPSMPHVRTFLRLLTGSGRINNEVPRRIPAYIVIKGPTLKPEAGGRSAGCIDCQQWRVLSFAIVAGCAV